MRLDELKSRRDGVLDRLHLPVGSPPEGSRQAPWSTADGAFPTAVVLGFLFLLARRVLPEPYRLKGPCAVVEGATIALTAGLGLYAGIAGSLV